MTPPADPNPGSAPRPPRTPPHTVKVTLPRASPGEPEIRIPPPRPAEANPKPAPPIQAGAPAVEAPTAPEVGRPQLRAPELKLETIPAPAPNKPAAGLRAPRSLGSIWMVRLGLLIGVGGALGLLYWSVFVRLLPVTAAHRDKALEMTHAADELEAMRNRWTPAQVREIEGRYERARSRLFDPTRDLGEWQTQVQDQGRAHVLQATVKVGEPRPLTGAGEGLSAIDVQVDLRPDDILGATTAPYGRLLQFTEALASSPKRLDFLDLSVTGDSNSVNNATAVVRLLAAERNEP